MTTILLWVGIAIIVIGWLVLTTYAIRQLKAQKQYARMPQKWDEVKHDLMKKRMYGRLIIGAGIIVLLLTLLLS